MKMQNHLWVWHVSTDYNDIFKYLGYDSYSDFVVVARSEEDARNIHPGGCDDWTRKGVWAKKEHIGHLKVTCIGLCTNPEFVEGQIICASFHAG